MRTLDSDKNRNTTWRLVGATVLYAIIPLTFERFGTKNDFLLAASLIEIISCIVFLGYLVIFGYLSCRTDHNITAKNDWRGKKLKQFKNYKFNYMIIISIWHLHWLLFLWSSHLIDTTLTTILFGIWPLWVSIFRIRIDRIFSSNNNTLETISKISRTPNFWTYLATFPFIFYGFLYICISQGEPILMLRNGQFPYKLVIGLLLAFLAGIVGGIAGACSTISDMSQPNSALPRDDKRLLGSDNSANSKINFLDKTGLFIYIVVVRVMIGFIILLAIFFRSNVFDSTIVSFSFLVASLILVIISMAGVILVMPTYNPSSKPWIIVIYHSTPVIAIVLLYLFTDGIHLYPGIFWIAVCILLISIFAFHSDPIVGYYFQEEYLFDRVKALSHWIWISLTIVVFRDPKQVYKDISKDISIEMWDLSYLEYWSMLGICATVFALILSFRINRLNEIERYEVSEFLHLHRYAAHYYEDEILKEEESIDLCKNLQKFQTSNKMRHIDKYYNECFKIVWNAYIRTQYRKEKEVSRNTGKFTAAQNEIADRARSLLDFYIRLDRFADARQNGRGFSELFALGVFCILTIVISLLVKPDQIQGNTSKWVSFITDITTICFSTIIYYLFTNVFERRKRRDTSRMKEVIKDGYYTNKHSKVWRFNFFYTKDSKPDRIAFILVFSIIIFTIIMSLGFKWFGS